MAELGLGRVSSSPGNASPAAAMRKKARWDRKRLILRTAGHAPASCPPPTTVEPAKAKRITSAIAPKSTVGSTLSGPMSRARSAKAVAPGGRLALRSQGRAVENGPRTTASSAAPCSTVRTISPAPGADKRGDQLYPGGADDFDGAVPEPVTHDHQHPGQAGFTEYRFPRNATRARWSTAVGRLDGGRERRLLEREECLRLSELAHRRPAGSGPVRDPACRDY